MLMVMQGNSRPSFTSSLVLVWYHFLCKHFNPRRVCAARVIVLGLSVCLSVTLHLTSGISIHPINDTMYSMGNEDQKICGVFSETTASGRYDVKRERKSQYANEYCLPRPSFAFVQRPFSMSVTPHCLYKPKARLNAMYSTT